jgi:hypothetical protein
MIIWIDDNPNRESTATDLGARFVNVKGKDLAPEIKNLLDGRAPQLVIVDHVLDKTSDNTHPAFLRGSTIAEAMKEKWPSCPVIGVTNAENLTEIDVRTKGTYDALFPFDNFGKYFDRIASIAHGFALVASSDLSIGSLVQLLKPPKDEVARLLEAFTDDLKAPAQDASVASRMHRWVDRLMGRPGFLFDKLWSATLLGLNEAGFAVVERTFDTAKYRGIFARTDEPHWWSARLSELLYKRCPPGAGELSRQAGRRLPGIKKKHLSVCYYCNEDLPETVAFLDEASTERRAMHFRCTVVHPLHKRELYFEDIRMMRSE